MFELTENMRVKQAEARGSTDEKKFAQYLLDVGNGRVPTVPCGGEEHMIRIPEELKSKAANLKDFFNEIYPSLHQRHKEAMKNLDDKRHEAWLMERAIISSTNAECERVNEIGVELLPGKPMVYHSSDRVLNESEAFNYPTELLWKITSGSMPPHTLVLKQGTPIMLLRNLDPSHGHVNGARYIVLAMTERAILARLATGEHKGEELLIPRIRFHPTDRKIPFEMERRQFPIRICFSITSNKSQGQTLGKVGINATTNFFSHGQDYVAKSRVGSSRDLKIYKPVDDPFPSLMKNVVFPGLL